MAKNNSSAKARGSMTRRELLEWLGAGTVLSLCGAELAACLGDGGADPGGSWLGDGGYDGGEGGAFAFAPGPGNHPVFEHWGVRTVDPQDIEEILASWRLSVDGMVERPRSYGFADLVALERTDLLMDFHCVEGWSVHDVPWNGIHLGGLFEASGVAPEATHVTFHTLGGKYNESLPIEIALEPHTLIAYGIAGNTLPLKHGFPLRLVVPRLFAYKSAKYVERIELTDHPVEGFWVAGGYPYLGEVPASRLRPGKY